MNEKPNTRKIGTVVLAVAVVEASWPELCRTLFSRFCPFRTEMSPNGDRIAYTGFCDQFDEIGEDGVPPRYAMSCAYRDGAVQQVEFTKLAHKESIQEPEPAKRQDVEKQTNIER
jgi:hypothetical protein